ncbi:MAG: hypothetical protein ABI193_17930 [Minicystis sp.]
MASFGITAPRARQIAAALSLGTALLSGSALADPTPEERAAARQMFTEGKELEKQKSWADALEKFRKVGAIKMTPQVRFHIALCEENVGHLVAAINGFELAAEEARSAGSSAAEVADNAPARAEALRKRVATLRLSISGKQISSKIMLDGSPLGKAAQDVTIPLDPGDHVIEVQDASGKSTFKKDLRVSEAGSESVEITFADVEPVPSVSASAPPPPPPLPPRSRAPAYIAGGLGVALIVTSGVFYGLRAGTISELTDSCTDKVALTGCDPTKKDLAGTGATYGTVSAVTLGAGLAALGTAGVLFFVLGPRKQPAAPGTDPPVSLGVAPMGTGLRVIGTF